MLPVPTGPCVNYARVTLSVLSSLSHTAVWARVPLVAPAVSAVEGTPEEDVLLAQARAQQQRQQRRCRRAAPHTHRG